MSEILSEIDKRRAYRGLSEEKIPQETIERIMKAATYAPSCFNSQSWRFLVVSEKGALAMLHESLVDGNYWAKKAPIMVAVATKPELDCRKSDMREYALFDCGLATQNLILQAVKEGLYAHPMAGFDPLVVKRAFSIPEDFIVITLLALGYPGNTDQLSEKHRKAEVSPRVRKPDHETICYNQWKF